MKKTQVASVLALGALVLASAPEARAQGALVGGTMWNESEVGWQGTWTRIGRSNEWDAVWTKGSQVVHARLTITIQGTDVFVDRRDLSGGSAGKGCSYNGTLRGRTITGTYGCDWKRGLTWKATIAR